MIKSIISKFIKCKGENTMEENKVVCGCYKVTVQDLNNAYGISKVWSATRTVDLEATDDIVHTECTITSIQRHTKITKLEVDTINIITIKDRIFVALQLSH